MLGIAAAAYDWGVEAETAVLCSAVCCVVLSVKGNSFETAVRHVTVRYEEDRIIFCWSGIFSEVLRPFDEEFLIYKSTV